MNINESFPSQYLKAGDLQGHSVAVSIEKVGEETVGEDLKPVVYFNGKDKGLVLNKTNAMTIAARYGPETEGWANAEIELYPDKTNFQGQMVDCLRVRLPAPPVAEGEEAPF